MTWMNFESLFKNLPLLWKTPFYLVPGDNQTVICVKWNKKCNTKLLIYIIKLWCIVVLWIRIFSYSLKVVRLYKQPNHNKLKVCSNSILELEPEKLPTEMRIFHCGNSVATWEILETSCCNTLVLSPCQRTRNNTLENSL